MRVSAAYQVPPALAPGRFTVRETPGVTPARPRLLDRVRAALRARHYRSVATTSTSRSCSAQ
jgi:hypothetical protein